MLPKVFRWATVRQGVWVIAVKKPQHCFITHPSRGVSVIPGHGHKCFLHEREQFMHTCFTLSPQEILRKTEVASSVFLSFLGFSSDPGSNLGCRQEGNVCALPCTQGKINVSILCWVYITWAGYCTVHGIEVCAGNSGGSQPSLPHGMDKFCH